MASGSSEDVCCEELAESDTTAFLQGSDICGFIKRYNWVSQSQSEGLLCVLFWIQDVRRGMFFSLEVLYESLWENLKSQVQFLEFGKMCWKLGCQSKPLN